MKKKTGIYLVIGIVGIALALSARFLLQDCLSDSQSGAMIGIGAGLFGYGIAKWCVALWGAKNPDLMKINEIEGLYRPFSNEPMVCRDTSSAAASSSCLIPRSFRISSKRFFTVRLLSM